MSDADLWIVIPNWDKFQHYGIRRDAPWIKVYGELNSRDEWRRLPHTERGLLVSLWLEYQRSGGQLRTSDVGQRVGQPLRRRSLISLCDAGFIQLSASKPLALRALAREEKSREERTGAHTPKKTGTKAGPRANADAYQQQTNNIPDRPDELPDAIANWLEQHPKRIQ